MSDDFNDRRTPDDTPHLQPLRPGSDEVELRRDYSDPPVPRTPGFGFWLAVAWALLYFVATQVVGGIVFGIPIMVGALMIDGQLGNGGMPDLNAWMKSPTGSSAMLLVVGCTQF